MVHKIQPSKLETEMYLEGYDYGLKYGKYPESFIAPNAFRKSGYDAGINEFIRRKVKREKEIKVALEPHVKEKVGYLNKLVKQLEKRGI
jgi:hypothetical protein